MDMHPVILLPLRPHPIQFFWVLFVKILYQFKSINMYCFNPFILPLHEFFPSNQIVQHPMFHLRVQYFFNFLVGFTCLHQRRRLLWFRVPSIQSQVFLQQATMENRMNVFEDFRQIQFNHDLVNTTLHLVQTYKFPTQFLAQLFTP